MPQKELDIVLGQPTFWQLHFFINVLSEKLTARQSEFQPTSSISNEDVGGEIEILQAEVSWLSKIYAELLSRKVMCKLDHLEKICSPQTIVNLAKKYYQIYAECLTQLLFLEKQRFSAPIAGFANKFISKYRAVTDFIDHFLVKTRSQLQNIPEYGEDKDYELSYDLSLYPPEDIINEFTE